MNYFISDLKTGQPILWKIYKGIEYAVAWPDSSLYSKSDQTIAEWQGNGDLEFLHTAPLPSSLAFYSSNMISELKWL